MPDDPLSPAAVTDDDRLIDAVAAGWSIRNPEPVVGWMEELRDGCDAPMPPMPVLKATLQAWTPGPLVELSPPDPGRTRVELHRRGERRLRSLDREYRRWLNMPSPPELGTTTHLGLRAVAVLLTAAAIIVALLWAAVVLT